MTKVETGHFNMSKSDKGSFLFNTAGAAEDAEKEVRDQTVFSRSSSECYLVNSC